IRDWSVTGVQTCALPICSHCGAHDLESTGQFEDHFVADLPEPKLEWHRYRRYISRCRCCQRTCQGRGDLELPGAHIGPRARLLTDRKGVREGKGGGDGVA